MKKTIDRNNRLIQMKWISSIRKLPNYKKGTNVHDENFNQPIKQKENGISW